MRRRTLLALPALLVLGWLVYAGQAQFGGVQFAGDGSVQLGASGPTLEASGANVNLASGDILVGNPAAARARINVNLVQLVDSGNDIRTDMSLGNGFSVLDASLNTLAQVGAAGWIRAGQATDANAEGDISAGAAGGQRFFWDQSGGSFTVFDATTLRAQLDAGGVLHLSDGSNTNRLETVSASALKITSDGTQLVTLHHRQLLGRFSAARATVPTPGPTLGSRGTHQVLSYADSADRQAFFPGVMPIAYSGGTVTVSVEYTSPATTGNVQIFVAVERMEAGVLDIDSDSFDTERNVISAVAGTSGVVTRAQIDVDPADLDGLLAGEGHRVRIRRDATVGNGSDTAAGAMEVLRVYLEEAD